MLTSLGIVNTVDSAKVNLLAGCGLAVFNVRYGNTTFDNSESFVSSPTTFSTNAKTALFCASCKPGYKAEYYNN